jgi:hypothetical protein
MIPSARLGATLYKLDIVCLIAFRLYQLWLAFALAYIALASMSGGDTHTASARRSLKVLFRRASSLHAVHAHRMFMGAM